MKKTIFYTLCTAIACTLVVGCASTGSLKKDAVISPLGIISVTSNSETGWYGEEKRDSGLLGNLAKKAVKEELGEDLGGLLVDAEQVLRETLTANGIQVIEPSAILGSTAYHEAQEDPLKKNAGLLAPAGYRFVALPAKNKTLTGTLAQTTGMKSGLYVHFKFDKIMDKGIGKNGTAKACVSISGTLVDETGAVILQNTWYGESTDTFTIAAGIYDPKELMKHYPQALTKACDAFAAAFVR